MGKKHPRFLREAPGACFDNEMKTNRWFVKYGAVSDRCGEQVSGIEFRGFDSVLKNRDEFLLVGMRQQFARKMPWM